METVVGREEEFGIKRGVRRGEGEGVRIECVRG